MIEVGIRETNDEISAPRPRLCHNFVERMWSRGLEEQKGFLPLPSLIGKQDYDEKDISTLRSEAPQQARLASACLRPTAATY